VTGSPRWAAPEYFDSNKEKTEKGDLFSFGVILWELVTKQLPWVGIHDEEEIKRLLVDGKRLGIPASCGMKLKGIIQECWEHGSCEY
jgi:serine/threonine protein kinase